MGSRSEQGRTFEVTLSQDQAVALEVMYGVDKMQGGNKTQEEILAEGVDALFEQKSKTPEFKEGATKLLHFVEGIAKLGPDVPSDVFLGPAPTDIVDRGNKGPNPGPPPPSR